MIWRIFKYAGLALLCALMLALVSTCTMLGMTPASLETNGKPTPRPPIAAASLEAWRAGQASLKRAFEAHVYGPWPGGLPVELVERRMADENFLDGRARLEELTLRVGDGPGAADFRVAVAIPDEPRPLGLVIGQTFSSNCSVFQTTVLTDRSGERCTSTELPWIIEFVFGEYIAAVPFEAYFDAGFAYASFQASDLVPDRARRAPDAMEAMGNGHSRSPTGTLMAWAYGYSAAIDALSGDDWLDPDRIAIYGHSRHGKSALLAGIWDRRIDAVIAHQSGFGGAALSRSTVGEGLRRVSDSYPHWFDPAYASYAGRLEALPVDQHQLLALMAPTPLFLGNARRDVWSDPNSTFRAAMAAGEIYRLHGLTGLTSEAMTDYDPASSLAYFLRPGFHGTDQRDIDAMLAFLTAHLGE